MKNKLKMLLIFMTGILISSATVYAATQYLSSDVTFFPSDSNWNVSNVEEALNQLYEKKHNITIDFTTWQGGTSTFGGGVSFVRSLYADYSNFKIVKKECESNATSRVIAQKTDYTGEAILEFDKEYNWSDYAELYALSIDGRCVYTLSIYNK